MSLFSDRERRWHPATDLRVVYLPPDPLRAEARALADVRGDDEVVPGESEAFAATAQALSRGGDPPSGTRRPRS